MPEATPTQTPGLDIPKPHKKDSEVAPEMDPEELKRLKANLATGMNKFRKDQGEKIYLGKKDVQMVLGEEEIAMSDSIYFKKCQDCTFTIRATCTKIFIESCDRIRFNFEGKVITHTVEVWKCKGFEAMFKTPVKTLQVDLCEGVKVEWEKSDDFNRVVWSATEDLSLSFGDSEEHKINVGSQKMAKLNPNVNPETDQFIIRLLPNKITNKPTLLNELIVRLENGFPTTEREARQFEERQEANLQALARELLGKDVAIGKKKAVNVKVNRNGPCVCGSDKKYKKCCGTNAV